MSIKISWRKNLAYYLPLFICILSGCAASGPTFNQSKIKAEANKSRLIIYNPASSSFRTSHISVNKTTIGLLRRGGYLIHQTSSGTHSLGILGSNGSLKYTEKITLKENTTTYFKYNYRGQLIEYISSCGETENTVIVCRKKSYLPSLDLMNEKTALEELAKLKLSQD